VIADVIRRDEAADTREPTHQLAEQTHRLGVLLHALRTVYGIICFLE
jgi:hypothetical protein